ncbi:MAG: DNA recombination protein RmuC [Desulfobacterales bacterium]|jgi:DNA recombination protein RmuC|nr:DNA recombination protein RmuC [Desulfobacteraceae bacterium]MDY0313013.1 DNA recombination protein RmuC [Desulfobacterales bacterium]
MPILWEWVAVTGGALAIGALAAMLVLHRRIAGAHAAGRAALTPEIERLTQALAQSTADLNEAQSARHLLETRLAASEQAAAQIPELKAAAAQREARQAETIAALQERLAQKEGLIGQLRTGLEEARRQAEEKIGLLQDARRELTDQFRLLAQEVLEEKGRVFGERSQADLKGLLDPFRDQLNEFKRKVDDVYVHEAAQRAALKKEVETLRDLNRQMGQEAVNLTRALKGDKKAQGLWGELVLERVLEKSGLRNGIEYETQGAFRDADGRLLRPDVVVHLPGERCVVVDAKVSLAAYARYVDAETEPARRGALAEHVQAVRHHIEDLGAKDYTALKGLRSLDYILMFMPMDAAFTAAFRADEDLYTRALERHVVVVTPSTLLATLKTIDNIWRYERQNRSAQEIFVRAGAIYEKLRLFLESMERLGTQLATARGTYDDAMNRLTRGKGNVVSQLGRFADLGVATKKTLPASVLEAAELDETAIPRAAGSGVPTP